METTNQIQIPHPMPNESKSEYVGRCIVEVVGHGFSVSGAENLLKANWDKQIESKYKSKLENKTILKK